MIDQHLLNLLRDGEILSLHSRMNEGQVVDILGRPEDIARYSESAHVLKYGNLRILFEHDSIMSFQLRPAGNTEICVVNSRGLQLQFSVSLDIDIILNDLKSNQVPYETDKSLTFDSQITYHVGKYASMVCDVETREVDHFSAFFYNYYVR